MLLSRKPLRRHDKGDALLLRPLCVCMYQLAHNRANRPYDVKRSMLLVLIPQRSDHKVLPSRVVCVRASMGRRSSYFQ